jgi:hypothetical protein
MGGRSVMDWDERLGFTELFVYILLAKKIPKSSLGSKSLTQKKNQPSIPVQKKNSKQYNFMPLFCGCLHYDLQITIIRKNCDLSKFLKYNRKFMIHKYSS